MSDLVSSSQVQMAITGTILVKVGSGRIIKLSQLTPGAVAIHDIDTTGGVAASNQIAAMPSAAGIQDIDLPFLKGLVIVAGAAVVAVGFT